MAKTWRKRLEQAWDEPGEVVIKLLQGVIDHLRGYSYNFDKNGERQLLATLSTMNLCTVFDVGANVGDWSHVAASYLPQANIHCFELSPRTFQTLQRRLTGRVFHLNNAGMSDEDGEIEFKDYGENSTVNTLLTTASYHDARLPASISRARVVRGTTYCHEHGIASIDLLKIDVEGADHLVLRGFADLFAAKAIRIVQFEYGYTHGDAHFLMRDFCEWFEARGYAVGRLTPRGVAFQPWHYRMNDFRSGPNYVAVRADDAIVMERLRTFRR